MNTITYKLACELKAAGFPQKHDIGTKTYSEVAHPRLGIPHQYAVSTQVAEYPEGYENTDPVIPTLSELIAWCGEGFGSLHRFVDYPAWYAYPYKRSNNEIEQYEGSTPEIAVALLGISLYKHGQSS